MRGKIKPDQEKPRSDGLHLWAVGMCCFVRPGVPASGASGAGGGGGTYFVDADLSLHILEPLLEDGDECGRWH